MTDAAATTTRGRREFFTGPKLKVESVELMSGVAPSETRGATWRGWLLGFLCVTLLGCAIPYLDMVMPPTIMTNSLFPASSMVFLFVLLLGLNLLIAAFRSSLGLTRQDLVLVFCMTMLTNCIPGCGFWAFWVPVVIGGQYFATPENNWANLLQHMPPSWAPHDNPAANYRPIEWFYIGVPNRADSFFERVLQVPWSAWLVPYAVWCLALLMLFGIMFALCGLLRRQWADHERLAFPIAQLPEELVASVGTANPRPFLKDKAAWWGIGLVFALYALNNLGDYYRQVPQLILTGGIDQYLTEEPWSALRPISTNIYISVIGLSYLISLEVSFSVWFYWAVMRVVAFFFIRAGVADGGWFFAGTTGVGWRSLFRAQGTGALLTLAVLGIWMARRELRNSLLQALDLRPAEPGETGFSPRVLWLLLGACVIGSVVWLYSYGVEWYYASAAMLLLILILIALTRLYCEGGLFAVQVYDFPFKIVQSAVTPSALSSATFVKLSIWDRVMVADWFRVTFMPVIMNNLHLATRTGLTRRSVMLGMGSAVVLALAVSFGSLLYTAYARPGGANTMQWYFHKFPGWEFGDLSPRLQQMEAYQKKLATAEGPLPASEVPDVARHDWIYITCFAVGSAYMGLSLWLRSFVFWFPHPLGYVMWMASYPHFQVWFSFLIGWALKKGILKYGGSRAYLRAKRFFIGLVVGEALGVVVWKIVAAVAGNYSGFGMLPG